MRRLLAPLLWLFAPVFPAAAQPVVTSPSPDAVSVTIYRNPDRGEGAMRLASLGGFALISETRTIAVPAGEAVIRFEGVAGGMIAVSAVVTGLPGGVIQKNRDARLLSPAALVDGSLGNRVHLRRTDRATGKVVEQDVVIRSATAGALVLETAEGFEALGCSGLPESIGYDGVPAGLSASPVLSVTTASPAAASARVTLTYLATGFDWGADYVARIDPATDRLDLFAWLTVANDNDVGFADAGLQVVAGRLNREEDSRPHDSAPSPWLALQCWPLATTTTDLPAPPPPPPPPPPAPMMDIMVTAQRSEMAMAAPVMAVQEELGDLKLYRVPVRVDVDARGQKQVALLEQKAVPFTLYYRADVWQGSADGESRPLQRMLRLRNRKDAGLGLPLPSGGVALMERRDDGDLLLARGDVRDHAVGETVDLRGGDSAQVRVVVQPGTVAGKAGIILTNATPMPARVELAIGAPDGKRVSGPGIVRRDGRWLWIVTVPANGEARLDYVVASSRPGSGRGR